MGLSFSSSSSSSSSSKKQKKRAAALPAFPQPREGADYPLVHEEQQVRSTS